MVMMKIKGLVQDRKVLVQRLWVYVNIEPVYTRAPDFAYDVGPYRVDREGNLLVPEDADPDILWALRAEGLIEKEQAEEAIPTVTEIRLELPMEGHSLRSLRNLINLLYTRAPMINKAVGGHFRVDPGLVDMLKTQGEEVTVPDLLEKIKAYEAEHGRSLDGLELTQDQVRFTGFTELKGQEMVDACTRLVDLMNKQALNQKRIQAKKADEANEKYTFRTWLIRLGMTGKEYKEARKTLLAGLDGHSAFRTQEAADRAKEKAANRRLHHV